MDTQYLLRVPSITSFSFSFSPIISSSSSSLSSCLPPQVYPSLSHTTLRLPIKFPSFPPPSASRPPIPHPVSLTISHAPRHPGNASTTSKLKVLQSHPYIPWSYTTTTTTTTATIIITTTTATATVNTIIITTITSATITVTTTTITIIPLPISSPPPPPLPPSSLHHQLRVFG
ncbi:hypothetical protein E2C01_019026 [Portunus trituberculatus]|uniref:Uncharacterized protein n=1 Tax=Portunus trituberculatus TaxID=210409 RepID=A0A5B7DW52_PORTR|nr:hypothetical protein [Portunus trituberculatus]